MVIGEVFCHCGCDSAEGIDDVKESGSVVGDYPLVCMSLDGNGRVQR